MTNTYSGDPGESEKDAVRYILSDTAAPWKFSDEEIAFEILTNGSAYAAAAEIAWKQGGKYVDRRDKTVGPLSIKYGELSSRWYAFSKMIKSKVASKSGGARAILTQRSRTPHTRLGMHDNPTVRTALEFFNDAPLILEGDSYGIDGGDIDEV